MYSRSRSWFNITNWYSISVVRTAKIPRDFSLKHVDNMARKTDSAPLALELNATNYKYISIYTLDSSICITGPYGPSKMDSAIWKHYKKTLKFNNITLHETPGYQDSTDNTPQGGPLWAKNEKNVLVVCGCKRPRFSSSAFEYVDYKKSVTTKYFIMIDVTKIRPGSCAAFWWLVVHRGYLAKLYIVRTTFVAMAKRNAWENCGLVCSGR